MREIVLLKCGELALKGLNRRNFEEVLMKNCRRRLEDLGTFRIHSSQSTIYVEPMEEEVDLDEAVDRLTKVFGIAALTRSAVVEKSFEAVRACAPTYLRPLLMGAKTFKVEAKRSDKQFPMKSPELCRELGAVSPSMWRSGRRGPISMPTRSTGREGCRWAPAAGRCCSSPEALTARWRAI